MRDIQLLHNLIPNATQWTQPLVDAVRAWGVSPHRVSWWLANLLHESAGFTRLEESLHYTPARVMAVWPHRFPTLDRAREATRSPEALAEAVYAGRLGNTPGTGDAWRYRGRGAIQLTGRDNYARYQQASNQPVLENPDLLLTPRVAADAAAWYWTSRRLNQAERFQDAVRGINGGLNGLADRRKWLQALQTAGLPTVDRLGQFDTLVLHNLDDTLIDTLHTFVLDRTPAILRGRMVASKTAGKLDVRITEVHA